MPLSASRKGSGVARHQVSKYFTVSFVIEVNEVRNRHLELDVKTIVGYIVLPARLPSAG